MLRMDISEYVFDTNTLPNDASQNIKYMIYNELKTRE